MPTTTEKTKLGIFALAAMILAIAVFAVFAGTSIFKSEDTYTILFTESVAGLNVGSPVRLRGVNVGGVREIRINPENVEEIEVRVGLKPNTPVMKDARAVVASVGLTGLQYIDLRHGTANSERLKPGSSIPVEASLIGQLSDSARDISAKSYQIVDQVSELTRIENRKKLESILNNADELVANLNELSKELTATLKVTRRVVERSEPSLVKTLDNVSKASEGFERVVRRADYTMASVQREVQAAQIAQLVNGLGETNTMVQKRIAQLDVAGTFDGIAKTLAAVQRLLGQVVVTLSQNEEQVRATLFNLRQTSENFKQLSQQLRNDPSRLLFESSPEERTIPQK